VISLQSAIVTAQSWIPNDEATITVAAGAGDLAGSVTFELFDNATCTGTALYSEGPLNVADGTGTGLSRTLETNNTTFAVSTSTTVYWKVTFTSTNPGIVGVTSNCTESTQLIIDN
jgi:hypothetical protein